MAGLLDDNWKDIKVYSKELAAKLEKDRNKEKYFESYPAKEIIDPSFCIDVRDNKVFITQQVQPCLQVSIKCIAVVINRYTICFLM